MSEENKPQEHSQEEVSPLNRSPYLGAKQATVLPLSAPLQRDTIESVRGKVEEFAKKNKLNEASIKELNTTLESAFSGMWLSGMYDAIGANVDEWATALKVDNKVVGISHPRIKLGKINKADEVIRAVSSATDAGKPTIVDLPHSGISVELGIFRERELIMLQTELCERRLDVGKNTRGAMLTSDDVHYTVTIVDCILRHVVGCNVRLPEGERVSTLRKLILASDLHILMVGALAGIYPTGYPMIRRCLEPECGYSTYKEDGMLEHIDFKYLTKLKTGAFPAKRLRFIKAVKDAHSVEQVLAYQEEYAPIKRVSDNLSTNDVNFTATVKVPDYDHYRTYNTGWLNSLTAMIDEALALNPADNHVAERVRRVQHLNKSIERLAVMKHGSWVHQIDLGDEEDGYTISDTEEIYDALEETAKNRLLSVNIRNACEEIKVASIEAFVGLPVYDCPECGVTQQLDNPECLELITINPTYYFFVIMGYKQLVNG